MSVEVTYFVNAVVIGVGATLFMDAWALLMKRALSVPLANYCLVGRWLCHMRGGTFMHASIATAPRVGSECIVGWIAHYLIGVAYAVLFVAIVSGGWLAQPALLPAVLFGAGSVLVPYLVMQPAFGLGVAASKAPQPAQARLRSLMAHTSFGVGMYACAVAVRYALQVHD